MSLCGSWTDVAKVARDDEGMWGFGTVLHHVSCIDANSVTVSTIQHSSSSIRASDSAEVMAAAGIWMPAVLAGCINRKYMQLQNRQKREIMTLFSKVASSLCAGGYFVATVPDPSRSWGHHCD